MLQRNYLAKPIPSIMDNALDSNTNTSKTHQNPLSHPPLTLDSILKEIKSGSGHLQGISKPGEWKHRVEPWLFCFLALGKACFPSHSLTHSFPPHTCLTTSLQKSVHDEKYERILLDSEFSLYFDNHCGAISSSGGERRACKAKMMVVKVKKCVRRCCWKEAGCPICLASQGQEQWPLAWSAVRNGNVSQKPPSSSWSCQFAGDN